MSRPYLMMIMKMIITTAISNIAATIPPTMTPTAGVDDGGSPAVERISNRELVWV